MNTHQTTNWTNLAKQLWEDGMTVFPLDETLVEPARTGFKHFLLRRAQAGDHREWSLARDGEEEFDLGLVQRQGGKYDVKSFFHHDSHLEQQLAKQQMPTDPADATFLQHNARLLHHVSQCGRHLTAALDELYTLHCHRPYERCLQHLQPYSVTTLRSLYYPDGPTQTGAKAHIDRSFLTIHLGDQGGKLQALQDDGTWMDISPAAGFAVAFFGVKVLWQTNGKKTPLRHRSVTFPGQDRFAFVHFGHVPTSGYQVTDAQLAQQYWQKTWSS